MAAASSPMSTTAGPRLLAVEGDPQMRRFLRASLTSHGFALVEASSAKDALALAASHHPEAMLIDLGLPDEDGVTLIQRLRQSSQVPIIVISGRHGDTDTLKAFEAGADDYLTKPFGVDELLVRIRVVLHHAPPDDSRTSQAVIGPLRVDFVRGEVTLAGRHIQLTSLEYRLLALLARRVGKLVTHGQLLDEIYGDRTEGHTHHVRVYVAQLRRKIEIDPARPRLLLTETGIGYRLLDRTPPVEPGGHP
jgi:two-component system KDP operon response regulator KdpE